LLCFALAASGAAGLVYEVAWIKWSALVIGSTSQALALVLAVFLAGLGAGSALFGRVAARTMRPFTIYARLELCVALCGVVSLRAFPYVSGPLATGLFVAPAAFLMGGTLPLFCRGLVHTHRVLAPVGRLYALNTAGAAVGCAAAGLLLIPSMGLRRTVLAAAAMNVAAALAARLANRLAPFSPAEAPKRSARRQPTTPPPAVHVVGVLCFLTGLVALANEVLWARFASLLIPTTSATYTLTLTIVLTGIVVGSVVASWLEGIERRLELFGVLQAAIGLSVLLTISLPPDMWHASADRMRTYILLFLPASVLSGASFPLAVRLLGADAAGVPKRVGYLTALNVLGGIAGAVGAAVLLPRAGLHTSLLLTTGASVVAAGIAYLGSPLRTRRVMPWLLTLTSVAAWIAIPRALPTQIPRDFLAATGELVDFREGVESNLAVMRAEGRKMLTSDGWWQGQDERSNQIMAAHVPMILHPHPSSVLVVGVGAGQTPARFTMYDVSRIDVVDIEPEVFDLVQAHFNGAWMRDPRVRLIHRDGRAFILHSSRTYDVISIEVGQLLRPGIGGFYTREFYERARTRLAPGGILSQFVPLSFLSVDDFAGVLRTFADVFPQCALWYNRSELLLIGRNGEPLTIGPSGLGLLAQPGRVHDDLEFSLWGGQAHALNRPEMFVAGFLAGPAGIAAISRSGEVLTDDRSTLEYRANASSLERLNYDAILAEIRAHADPVDSVVEAPPPEWIGRARLLRDQNVRDMFSWSLVRRAGAAPDSQSAIALLIQAVEANPESIRALNLLAVQLLRVGRDRDALETLERAAAIDPDEPLVQRDLGSALWKTGRRNEALGHYRTAVALHPDDAEAQYFLGGALSAMGLRDEGLAHLRRALQLRPNYPAALEAVR